MKEAIKPNYVELIKKIYAKQGLKGFYAGLVNAKSHIVYILECFLLQAYPSNCHYIRNK